MDLRQQKLKVVFFLSGASFLLDNSKPRNNTKLYHTPNFTKEIHWGEVPNGGCLQPGTETAEDWVLRSPIVGILEDAQLASGKVEKPKVFFGH